MKLTALAIAFTCSLALVSAAPVPSSDSGVAPSYSGANSAENTLMRRKQKKGKMRRKQKKGKKDKKDKKGKKDKKPKSNDEEVEDADEAEVIDKTSRSSTKTRRVVRGPTTRDELNNGGGSTDCNRNDPDCQLR
jgi:hypothetical protein